MGQHKEWRKLAKKMRRKRIRSATARERDEAEKERMENLSSDPYYKVWLAEQEALEKFQEQEERRASIFAHQKWEYMETVAQEKWARRQKILLEEEEKRKEQEALIRMEWEKEQEKERLEREERDQEEKRKRLHYEKLMEEMESFIHGTGVKPDSLYTFHESNPGKEPCLFYNKVGSCRFKDACSRNHVRPGISNIILIPGFYTHFSLEAGGQGEYDTDIQLEYDASERFRHFKEFFEDITPELEKFGRIQQLRVCSNTEPHLRGNVYVAYKSERAAAAAYKALNGRYYASKLLSVEFVKIPSWKDAACGLQFRGKCPKGSKCNFLHIFRNPRGLYTTGDITSDNDRRKSPSPKRDWRWTPSPPFAEDETPEDEVRTSRRRRSDNWEDVESSRDFSENSNRRRSSYGQSSDRRSRRSRSRESRNSARYRKNGSRDEKADSRDNGDNPTRVTKSDSCVSKSDYSDRTRDSRDRTRESRKRPRCQESGSVSGRERSHSHSDKHLRSRSRHMKEDSRSKCSKE